MHTTEISSDIENIIPFPSAITTIVITEVKYHQIHLSEIPF
jgi:hypothetical protein